MVMTTAQRTLAGAAVAATMASLGMCIWMVVSVALQALSAAQSIAHALDGIAP
jgi:hypothetical protein